MGTAVGCACGDGVIDWEAVMAILRTIPQDVVLSVECGTLDEAARSIEHLRKVREKK
jgi:sugar phosphate isomerase/epimerase